MSEDELAQCLGRFLHSCPGLNKVAIGELLGEPDPFYLKVRRRCDATGGKGEPRRVQCSKRWWCGRGPQVLDAYTASFDFTDLKFDAGIRMFLESFKLPGQSRPPTKALVSNSLRA